ncbi:glycosyltransferase family 39 protein [Parahaliea mediterranea]|uniref:glycosyltransferase family 39 protein n=1 Tax=Parahaliea mediterranea TaxID=651086 RepID=UPI000E2FA349|nr:glycosyltransferase family 39 protein [Parahaliea mediterranea]
MNNTRYQCFLIALTLFGLMLRLIGLNWDEGRGLHPDEGNLVRAALELWPAGSVIPSFHAYNDLALWLPRLLSLPFCDSADQACLTLSARWLSALVSVATIPVAAALARLITGQVAGLVAAAAFAGSAPLVQWAHFGTTESVLVLLVMVLWLVAARWLAGQITDRRMMLWSASLLGIGFGFKTTAIMLSIIPLAALVLGGRVDRARWRLVAAGVLLTAGLALLSAPSLWLATDEWLAVMRHESAIVTGTQPAFWVAQFEGVSAGGFELTQLASSLAWVGLPLALLGLLGMSQRGWRYTAPGLAFAACYAAIVVGWEAKFFRYLAPIVPILLLLAATALGRCVQHPRSQTVRGLGCCALGLILMAGIDQASIYWSRDARILAESALLARALPNEVVAIEPHDLAQTADMAVLTLPLTAAEISPRALAEPLSRAGWLLIASRRNWAVLPRLRQSAPVICSYYAALADGELGFAPALRFERRSMFGALFAPGLGWEETRQVFDRPEVILWRNEARLSEEALVTLLQQTADPAACQPPALASKLRRLP